MAKQYRIVYKGPEKLPNGVSGGNKCNSVLQHLKLVVLTLALLLSSCMH
jgi:hypothetical protein